MDVAEVTNATGRPRQEKGPSQCSRTLLAAFLVLAAGCSSEDCAHAVGLYLFQPTERSGDCGRLTESVISIDTSRTALGSGCTGRRETSADMCTTSIVSARCELRDSAGTLTGYSRTDGTLHEVSGPDRLEGIWTICLEDASAVDICCSTYDITATPA